MNIMVILLLVHLATCAPVIVNLARAHGGFVLGLLCPKSSMERTEEWFFKAVARQRYLLIASTSMPCACIQELEKEALEKAVQEKNFPNFEAGDLLELTLVQSQQHCLLAGLC